MSQRLFNNSVFNVIRLVVNLAIAFLLTPLLVRGLGREDYGIWILAAAFSATGYFNLLEFGLQSAVVKYVAEYQVAADDLRVNRMVGASLAFHLAFGVVAFAAIGIIAEFFLTTFFRVSPEQTEVLTPLLWLLATQTLFEFPALTVSGILEGVQAIAIVRAVEIMRAAMFGIGCLVLLSMGHGVLAMGWLSLAIAALALIAMIVAVRRLAPRVKPAMGFEREATVTMLRFSGKIFANRILATVYYQMDKTIIVVMLPVLFLTDYDIVMKVYGAAIMATGLISRNVVPLASALHAEGRRDELQRMLLRATRYETILSLPVTITLAVLAGPFIHFWVGEAYTQNEGLVRLILIEAAIVPLVATGYNVLVGMDRVTELVIALAVGTTLNLAISIALVPHIGFGAVLWGTVIANVLIVHPQYLRLMKRELGMSWRGLVGPTIGRVYPLALVFGASAWALVSWLEPVSLIAVLVTGALLGATGLLWLAFTALDAEERRALIVAVRAFQLRGALATTTGLDPKLPAEQR
jgi:O-antigen/teichoic acid export membrane protein